MKVNAEAQLAVKLYGRYMELYEAIGGRKGEADQRQSAMTEATADAAKLKSLARAISRIDEAYCNRELTNRERDRNLKLNDAVREIAQKYQLRVTRNHDPRGYAVYLHFPDGSYNSWGGKETGWGI